MSALIFFFFLTNFFAVINVAEFMCDVDHLTSVFGRVRSTRRVVFVQPLQDILNPPELFLNVPVYQLTLGGEEILLDKLFIETEKTHALLNSAARIIIKMHFYSH